MKKIEWDKSLSVGIKEIDKQHQEFIKILNKLNAKSEKEIDKIIKELINYSRYHFTTEEKYFKEYNYPYAQEHLLEHANILAKVIKFYDQHPKPEEIHDFLADWLEDHLKIHDMKYAKYFKEIGVNDC